MGVARSQFVGGCSYPVCRGLLVLIFGEVPRIQLVLVGFTTVLGGVGGVESSTLRLILLERLRLHKK